MKKIIFKISDFLEWGRDIFTVLCLFVFVVLLTDILKNIYL